MKKCKRSNEKKLVFKKISVLELNQLKAIKGGLGENNGNDPNTYSVTEVKTVNATGNGNGYSLDCP